MTSLLYSPVDAGTRGIPLALNLLRFLLAAFFVFVAMKNLMGDATMVADFKRFGYPNWFRLVTAAMQITGAVLLLRASLSFYGASVLTCVLLGAVWSHFRHDPPAAMIPAFAFLVPTLIILGSYRPPVFR